MLVNCKPKYRYYRLNVKLAKTKKIITDRVRESERERERKKERKGEGKRERESVCV